MKDYDQTTKGKAGRSFAQEMQLAFIDWVRKLPFIVKRNVPEDPDLETPGEVSAEEASAPRPTEDVPLGTPPDSERRPG
jgi:hypothetical protein